MRIVELIIDEDAELYGIDAISLVDKPAIELDFIALKDERIEFTTIDADKRIPSALPSYRTSLSTARTERTSSTCTSRRPLYDVRRSCI